MISSLSRMSLASVAMGLVVWTIGLFIDQNLGGSRVARFVHLALSIPSGAIVFYAACRWMRVPELDLALSSLSLPLRRLPGLGRASIG